VILHCNQSFGQELVVLHTIELFVKSLKEGQNHDPSLRILSIKSYKKYDI
jgi:hypothetical protein